VLPACIPHAGQNWLVGYVWQVSSEVQLSALIWALLEL
jgi:hypothetical protein